VDELLIAHNPDPDSTLPFLLRVPLGVGLVFRTSGTWPRTKALFCYPVHLREWPDKPEMVERVPVRSCVRRGAAIDLVLARSRENRSQTARTRKQARPNVSIPTARAAGIPDVRIVVDSHERYAYQFAGQQVQTRVAPLACGDYGLEIEGALVASVERKSLSDFVSSVTDGRLRFALGELAALPRAAVVVEERYSQLLKVDWVRPAVVLDGLAELQVRYPNVPIVFCETRPLAEEWTYRYLAAAQVWAETDTIAAERIEQAILDATPPRRSRSGRTEPDRTDLPAPVAEVRAWAIEAGMPVSDRGRLRPEVWTAWERAHPDRS
jgi:hypothetical protein